MPLVFVLFNNIAPYWCRRTTQYTYNFFLFRNVIEKILQIISGPNSHRRTLLCLVLLLFPLSHKI